LTSLGGRIAAAREPRVRSLRDTDNTEWLRRDIAMNAAYAHSAGNHGVSYSFAFTNFDGFDSPFKSLTGTLRATMNRHNVQSDSSMR
jgi:hypothetical protein